MTTRSFTSVRAARRAIGKLREKYPGVWFSDARHPIEGWRTAIYFIDTGGNKGWVLTHDRLQVTAPHRGAAAEAARRQIEHLPLFDGRAA